MKLVYRFGRETLVLPETLADHRQRGCLHTPYGIRAPSGGDGQCLRAVDAHQPVGFATGFGGLVEVVVLVTVLQFLQSLADGGIGQRAYPQSLKGQGTAGIGIEVTEYQFSFTGAVGCYDNTVALVPQLGYHLNLLHRRCVRLVALVRLHLTGNKLEPFGDDGQAVAPEALDAVPVGHGGLYQMPQCPCHVVAVSGEIPFFFLHCADNPCYLTGDARFFCQYGNHVFFYLIC